MHCKLLYSLLLTAALCIQVQQTSAQESKIPKVIQRSYIGFNYLANSAKYEGSLREYFIVPVASGDTSKWYTDHPVNETVRTKMGYGMTIGTFFPLTNLGGNTSALALSVEFNYNYKQWKQVDGSIYDQFGWNFFNASGATVQMGLPIGLDVKFGGEATTSNNHLLSAGFGAGIIPMQSLTSFEDNASTASSINPYIRMDGAIKAGILLKVRLQYTIGGPKYINEEGSLFGSFYEEYTTKTTVTGKGSFAASLILYPFSWAWPEHGWWQ